ncbi:MAG: CHRD domain-containing protein [Burkholderiales bacterium]|nr:CHRD domain-containing protein [Burkholderiales bacterium]MDE2627287.1 CHRD domain-containing protein [Burkholderiales bacterium]
MITVRNIFRATLLASTVAFAGCGMMPSSMASDTVKFGATLSGAAEVPPTNSAGTGTLVATLDKGSSVLNWRLSFSGLTGPAVAAHFHGPALPGANAGVVVPIPLAMTPAEGQATLTPAQVADLTAGKWYVNVHTAAHPGGEIRGQVMVK